MNWWNSLLEWVQSAEGRRIVTDAVLPFIAIVVAGVVAALIARSTGRRILDLHEREAKSAAVSSLIASARTATTWSTLGAEERAFSDRLADESNVRLRLLPLPGAGLAAEWADHEIAGIKANSATFTFQAEQSLADVRDRLVEWQAKPARAKKLFRSDLDRWKAEDEAVGATAPTSGPRQAVASDDGPAPLAPALTPRADWSAGAGAPVATPSFTPPVTAQTDSRPFEPPHSAAPTSPSDAPDSDSSTAASSESDTGRSDTGRYDTGSIDDREPAFSAPVSAHQVRRRTSPDRDDT